MKNLIYKDLRLTAHPAMYLFMLLSAMLLIPAYPYFVIFFYPCLGIFFTFSNGRDCRDICYTTLLPVRKRDVVRARTLTMIIIQLAFTILTVPFALLNRSLYTSGNPVGFDPNATFYGLALISLGLFNCIFLACFYTDAIRAGRAFVYGCIAITLFGTSCEIAAHLFPTLDGFSATNLVVHLVVLAVGIAGYVLLTLWGEQTAEKRFEGAEL